MGSHLPEEIGLFLLKACGDTLKIQKPPLNPSGDPVPLKFSSASSQARLNGVPRHRSTAFLYG
jgi:hypothetical protein